MPTDRQTFRAMRARDKELLANRKAPIGISVCADCCVPIQETSTGNRYYRSEAGEKRNVCSNCYFDAFDGVLTAHPVQPAPVIR